MSELWTVARVAEHFGVSESRARALLASAGIKRVSGYRAAEVCSVRRQGQGYRTDLERQP